MGAWDTVGFLLFEGFEVLDVYGPLEMIGLMKELGIVKQIIIVAETTGPVNSAQGPATIADYDFSNCPHLNILFVPGGAGTRIEYENQALLQFLKDKFRQLWYMVSVCTGAALLASAGLLDKIQATTNKRAWNWVLSISEGRDIEWLRQARFVKVGKVMTTAGVTAGIDGCLNLIGECYSEETANQIARRVEYRGDWRDGSKDIF